MAFGIFMELCYHHLAPYPQRKHIPLSSHPILSHPPPRNNQEFTLGVCGCTCSGRFPSVESHTVCPSVSASLTERRGLQVRPRGRKCWCCSLFCALVMLLCVEEHVCLYVHPLMYIWAVPQFGCCGWFCCEHMCTFCVLVFHLLEEVAGQVII